MPVSRRCNSALTQDIESFRSFTMAHPRLVQAKDELLSAIEASAPGSLILVIGPTDLATFCTPLLHD